MAMMRAASRHLRRCAAGARPPIRCLAAASPEREREAPPRLLFESCQSHKFKALSLFGGVYTSCWTAYVVADAFVIDPGGSIATHSGLISFIGLSSVTIGGYVVRTLASKTVGRLEVVTEAAAAPVLRVTTYGMTGGERADEAPLSSVKPLSDPNTESKLRTFSLPQDETRAYLVLVDGDDCVKDPAGFATVVAGVAPMAERADADGRSRRRSRRRKKRRG